MNVHELNRNQLKQLKEELVTVRAIEEGREAFMGELADADELVTDEEVFESYDGIDFTEDDFWE